MSSGSSPVPMMELGRAAAYVDYQALLGRRREAVRNAEVDQASLSRPNITSMGKPSVAFRLGEKGFGVFRHAQRARAHGAHRGARKAAQPLAEARERFQRPRFGRLIDAPVPRETCTQAHRISQVSSR